MLGRLIYLQCLKAFQLNRIFDLLAFVLVCDQGASLQSANINAHRIIPRVPVYCYIWLYV